MGTARTALGVYNICKLYQTDTTDGLRIDCSYKSRLLAKAVDLPVHAWWWASAEQRVVKEMGLL